MVSTWVFGVWSGLNERTRYDKESRQKEGRVKCAARKEGRGLEVNDKVG